MDFRSLKVRLARRRGFDGNPDRLGQFINDAIQEICGVRPQWSWLLRHHQFETKPPLTRGAASTGSVATLTAGTHMVGGIYDTSDATVTGALIALPDDNCYRISSVSVDARKGGGPTIFTEQPYRGATDAAALWKLYYDEYPLPSGAASVSSVVATGNGWTYPVRQESRRHQAVHSAVTRDAEASPLTYSVMMHSQLPVVPSAMWKAKDPSALFGVGGGVGVAVPGAAAVAHPEGVYYYWVANTVFHTKEVGPLSGPIRVDKDFKQNVALLTLPAMHDYGLRVFRSVRAGDIGSKESRVVPPPMFLADLTAYPGFPPTYRGTIEDGLTDDMLGHHLLVSHAYFGRHQNAHGSHRIRFWPPVDEHYLVDIQYFAQHPELVEDDEVTLIPSQYVSIALDFAEALALGEEENFAAAQAKRANGAQKLDAASMSEDVDPGTTLVVGGGESTEEARLLGGRWPKYVS